MAHAVEVVYNYVEEVDPNLVCAICQSALVNPVTTASCKHTFCRDCITRAVSHSPTCPIDRSALTLTSLADTEPLVRLMLDELKVRCEAPGCGRILQRGLLLAHLRTCSRAVVPCGDTNCGLSMARHRLPHHRAYECFHRRMACDSCNIAVSFREAKDGHGCGASQGVGGAHPGASAGCEHCGQEITGTRHVHRWICPKALVPCTQSLRGCTAMVARDSLEAHLRTCPFEALSSFFHTNDERFAALERRHDELRAENEGLRAQLWTLRRAEIVPRSLWDEPSSAIQTSNDSETEHNANLQTQRNVRGSVGASPGSSPLSQTPLPGPSSLAQEPAAQAGTQVEHSATRTDHALVSPASSPSPTTPPLPSPSPMLLPASAPSPPSRPHSSTSPSPQPPSDRGLHIPQSFLHPAPRASYTDWVIRRLPPPSAFIDTCAALRAALIHLAAGLDASERRNEVRIMTETLRVHEEVATLRAIVSPMRMQFLSDRPNWPSSATHPPPAQLNLPTPPQSMSPSLPSSDAASDDDDAGASIRESVVYPRLSHTFRRVSATSFVSTASASASVNADYSGAPSPRQWTGRPQAFPPPNEQAQYDHTQPAPPPTRQVLPSPRSFFPNPSHRTTFSRPSLGATILRRRDARDAARR